MNALFNFDHISHDENNTIEKESNLTILPGFESSNFIYDISIKGWLTKGKWQYLKKLPKYNLEMAVDGYVRKLNTSGVLLYDTGMNQFKPITGAINKGDQLLGFVEPAISVNGKNNQIQWQAKMSGALTDQSLKNIFATQFAKFMFFPNGTIRFNLPKGKSLGINTGFETQNPIYGKIDLRLKGLNLANSKFLYRGVTKAAFGYTTA